MHIIFLEIKSIITETEDYDEKTVNTIVKYLW